MQVSDFYLQYSWRNSKKIPYLNYVRRGIQLTPLFLYKMVACVVSVTAIITCINCISPDLACFINLQYLCRLHIALQIAQNDATIWITFFIVSLAVIGFGSHTMAGNTTSICVPKKLLWIKGHKDTLNVSSPNKQDSELSSWRIHCISHNNRSFEIRGQCKFSVPWRSNLNDKDASRRK